MQRLLTIIRLFKEYVVLALLSVCSLILLSLNDNPQIRVIRSYTIGAVGVFQSLVSLIPNVVALERELEILRRHNVSLTDEVSRLREARLENERLRALLQFKERSSFDLQSADIVGKTLDLMRNTVTLNVGETERVKPGMPLVSDAGLVGRVIETSSGYAVGELMINRDFRASAKIQRSRVVGIIAWAGGEYLQLRNVPKTQDVTIGDVVVTSEYSNVFPRDVKIGVVASVTQHEGGLFKNIEVVPSVDFARLEHVFVITRTPDPERLSLEEQVSP